MYKKVTIVVAAIIACQLSFAETCPSTADIKHHHLQGWKAYDSTDGTLLSVKRDGSFRKMAEQFALAEWVHGKNKSGSIRCYYRDNNGSDLEAYLAKDNLVPSNLKNYWYQVSGFMDCAASMDKCEFQSYTPGKKPQVAIISPSLSIELS